MRFALLALFSSCSILSQTLESRLEEKLAARIAAYDQRMQGVLAVAAMDLKTGKTWHYRGELVMPQASSIKVPILMEVFRQRELGRLNFAEKIRLEPKDAVGGSGVFAARLKAGPVETTVEELVREMIASSDNTATNWCIRRVSMAAVNQTMLTLGFPKTALRRVMLDQAAASRNEENVSTPLEMVRMMKLLHDGKAVNAKASEGMIAMMKLVKDDMRRAIPMEIEVAAKPGELTGVRTETGIVFLKGRPFALSVMGTFLEEPLSPIEDITRMVFAHFLLLSQGNVYGNLGVR
jgi:beta-lactamase class A